MKPTCITKTYTGSPCRIYSEGAVLADIPTGRVPAFLLQVATRTPAIAKHLQKVDVDGFVQGCHRGYVISEQGVLALAATLKGMRPHTQANVDATANLCTWFTNHLIPQLRQLTGTPASPQGAGVAANPGHKITISTATTEFAVEHLDFDEDVIRVECGGRATSMNPRAFFQALGLL